MIGQTLDRYRIESKLGEGGMGVVYKALDTSLGRTVAIKVLPPDKVSDPERKRRFIQEAKAASALNHPNIVTVHDIRSDDGVDFIVMEYAGPHTLDEVIPAKGLRLTQCLRYAVQIADALARAHQAGIVHRDLKPSNVIVTDDGRVKVLDFGLAKLLEGEPPGDAPTRTSPLTDEGTIVGTTAYMSPEQAEGRKTDSRSDIFSFGAMLYEMLTGRRAFLGDSRLAVLSKIVSEDPPPPRTVVDSVPPEVERTVMRCLRKDPERRHQTMADLKVALEELAEDSDSGRISPPLPVRARRFWRGIAAGLVIVALAAAVFVILQQRSGESDPLRAVPLNALAGGVRQPSFSPDGNQLAFTWTGPKQDNADVYVQQIGAGAPLRLTTDAADDYSPRWSPDGRSIAFLRGVAGSQRHELRLVPPLGGTERKLAEIAPRGFLRDVTLAWCPDSTCIIVTDASSPDRTKPDVLFVVSVESGEKRQLTRPEPPVLADTDPAVSPDGRWLVFRRDIAPFSGRLQLIGLDTELKTRGEPRALTPVLLTAYGPQWISNTEIIFWAKSALWRMNVSPESRPTRLPFVGEDGHMPTVFPPQRDRPGRLAYVRNFVDVNIWRLDAPDSGAPSTTPPVIQIASTRTDVLAQFSPDNQRIVFISNRAGESEVWASDAAGSNAVQLTRLAATPGWPAWSPDGKTIAFHSNSEEHPYGAIHVVPADGGRVRRITSNRSTDVFPSFSRDGRWIYFSSSRTGTPTIWKIPAAGGEAVQVSSTPALHALESRDGAYLYFVESSTTEAPGPLWEFPLKGGAPIKLADDVICTSFHVVDRGIYYVERTPSQKRISYFDFATRRSTVVAENLGRVGGGITASADGRTILFARVDSIVNDLMLVERFR